MKKESVLYGVIGLLAGVILSGATASFAVNNNHQGMMRMMGMRQNSSEMQTNHMGDTEHGGMSMNDMTGDLRGKTGDEFDKLFIEQMIDHHQGAIDMANLAKQNAEHSEIKELADEIIKAQSMEINEMESWQRAWGY